MDFLQIVIKQFAQNPFSSYIYSVEFCLKEYNDDELAKIFQEAFDVIAQRCARLLHAKEEIQNYPNIVEDFFSISKRMLKSRKTIFLECQSLKDIMLLAVKTIGTDHREAAESHSRFMEDLLLTLRNAIKESNKGIPAGAIANPEVAPHMSR